MHVPPSRKNKMIKFLQDIPIQVIFGAIAVMGGVARYLNGYKDGTVSFNLGTLCASAFVSGFAGYIFALIGQSLSMPQNILFIMAGMGGFFADQTMKYAMEYISAKIK